MSTLTKTQYEAVKNSATIESLKLIRNDEQQPVLPRPENKGIVCSEDSFIVKVSELPNILGDDESKKLLNGLKTKKNDFILLSEKNATIYDGDHYKQSTGAAAMAKLEAYVAKLTTAKQEQEQKQSIADKFTVKPKDTPANKNRVKPK